MTTSTRDPLLWRDFRSFFTKRKISGGSSAGMGVARDTMLGLMKTCQKLGLSFYH